jgi:hypothetical protein
MAGEFRYPDQNDGPYEVYKALRDPNQTADLANLLKPSTIDRGYTC